VNADDRIPPNQFLPRILIDIFGSQLFFTKTRITNTSIPVITWIIIDNNNSISPFQYNEAFSEDTQRGTDRLIRNIIQDLTELDREAIVKPGKQRSEVKVKAVEKRLTAAADALEQLSAFIVK
jgi:hypothetical protein